jgi:hypothetical protein
MECLTGGGLEAEDILVRIEPLSSFAAALGVLGSIESALQNSLSAAHPTTREELP